MDSTLFPHTFIITTQTSWHRQLSVLPVPSNSRLNDGSARAASRTVWVISKCTNGTRAQPTAPKTCRVLSSKNPQPSSLPCFGTPPTGYTVPAQPLHPHEGKTGKHTCLTRKRLIIVFLITKHLTLHHSSPTSPLVSLAVFSTHSALPPHFHPCLISSTPCPLPPVLSSASRPLG